MAWRACCGLVRLRVEDQFLIRPYCLMPSALGERGLVKIAPPFCDAHSVPKFVTALYKYSTNRTGNRQSELFLEHSTSPSTVFYRISI